VYYIEYSNAFNRIAAWGSDRDQVATRCAAHGLDWTVVPIEMSPGDCSYDTLLMLARKSYRENIDVISLF
jgi:hypothetical protein